MLSYETLIQKCTSTTSLKKARQLHALLLTSITITSQTPFLNNNLISMYSKSGSLIDSQLVFDKMPQRNGVSFNAIIKAHSRIPSQAFYAFHILSQMRVQGFVPNNPTFSSLLLASSFLEDEPIGTALHCQVFKFGYEDDLRIQTSLLGMYSNCGNFKSATRVFNNMGDKDDIAWNSMILSNLKNGKIERSLQLLDSMMRTGSMPTNFTYSMLLNACSKLGDHINGKIIHGQVVKCDLPTDIPLQNAVLDMYCRFGDTETAFYVFRAMENKDLVSWNAMISGFSENGDFYKAIYLFIQLCRTSYYKADEYTFAAIISGTGDLPAYDYGKPLHAQVKKLGFHSSIYVGSTLIYMYFKNEDTDSARKLFSSIREKDVIMWTEMISGHSRLGDGENAIKYFNKMQEEGHKLDRFSLSNVLSSCADLAALKQGEMIHTQVVKTGLEVDIFVCGSLVDMYAKNGDLNAAKLVFSQISEPDLKCWNSMLGGYTNHGKAHEAIQIYDEMLKQGLKPDQVTFLSLISACSHGGMVEVGRFFWDYMKKTGLVPGFKHYSCMVSLLCRSGLLYEAEELIEEAPFGERKSELWRILLSSCVVYRNIELGVQVADEVLRWKEEDSATLILLSNLYADAKRWDEVAEIRRNIRGMKLDKDPGLSWIEIMDKIHVFSSDDQLHLHVDEVKDGLMTLMDNMKKRELDEILCEY